ncbi:BQ5605_C006g03797 [Microbotryum silenes-dioicae]|uniref:BQ5605_C006g03797 protein n=1 Tax=Microbotryum silenes-dioicae TaxID=796604 RepID=A0A2X0P189_9BASI|nr:BQ5605_C006g03797 [Microbotryum silenes-dioicae]
MLMLQYQDEQIWFALSTSVRYKVARSHYRSKFDVAAAFEQVCVIPEHVDRTWFATVTGTYTSRASLGWGLRRRARVLPLCEKSTLHSAQDLGARNELGALAQDLGAWSEPGALAQPRGSLAEDLGRAALLLDEGEAKNRQEARAGIGPVAGEIASALSQLRASKSPAQGGRLAGARNDRGVTLRQLLKRCCLIMLNFILLQAFQHFNLGRPFSPRRFSRLGRLSQLPPPTSWTTGNTEHCPSMNPPPVFVVQHDTSQPRWPTKSSVLCASQCDWPACYNSPAHLPDRTVSIPCLLMPFFLFSTASQY